MCVCERERERERMQNCRAWASANSWRTRFTDKSRPPTNVSFLFQKVPSFYCFISTGAACHARVVLWPLNSCAWTGVGHCTAPLFLSRTRSFTHSYYARARARAHTHTQTHLHTGISSRPTHTPSNAHAQGYKFILTF